MNLSTEQPVPVRQARSAPSPEQVRQGRRPRLAMWGIGAAVLVVIAALAGILPRLHQQGALRKETGELAVETVLVAHPAPAKAAAPMSLPAEVKPLNEAPIYARANGYVKRWLVDIGEQVQAGQLLAEIDVPELNQELAQAKAQVSQAEAALALAKVTAARWADLLKTASVSEQEAAEKQSDLALKSATVDAAHANVRRLEEMVSFSHVTAPFAGTITARRLDIGELVSATGGRELFRLAQTRTLRVYVRVPQSEVRNIHPGAVAQMSIPEIPNRVFSPKVVRTSGAMDPASRTLLVELEQDNSSGELLAGTYAQVRFPDAKGAGTLTVPSTAVLFRGDGSQVGIVVPGGKVEMRIVKLGRDFGPTIEVIDGVSPADNVIVNPSDSLVSGVTVRIAEGNRAVGAK